MTSDAEHICRAMTLAGIKYLNLSEPEFEYKEALQVLLDSVRAQQGPKGHKLHGKPFGFFDSIVELINAL
jgi:hypothetical protein